jgi:hypothetical protein
LEITAISDKSFQGGLCFVLGLPQGPVAEVKSGSTRSPQTCCFASWKKFLNRFRMTGCFAYVLRVSSCSKTRLGLEELGPRQVQSDVSHRFGRRLASTTLKPCFFGHFVGGFLQVTMTAKGKLPFQRLVKEIAQETFRVDLVYFAGAF